MLEVTTSLKVDLRGFKFVCQGEGPIGLVGPISQPRGTIVTLSLTLDHTYALNVHFLSQLYFRQLRVSCVLM